MMKKLEYSLACLLLLSAACGSLDGSDTSGGSTGVTLLLKNPDENASGSAKAVSGGIEDLSVSKAAATLSVTACDISCTDGTTTASESVTFASGASEVSASLSCPASSSVTISATCADSSKTSNEVKFGFTCSTNANLSTSSNVTCTGLFLNQATRSSGDCRYARFAQDNNTQISVEWGFDGALTDTQKTTAKANMEVNAGNSDTDPGTVDTSSDGLKGTKTNPYITMEGGLNNPSCFKYNTSGTKELRGTGSWATDADGNTKAVCKFGVTQWIQFDDRNFRYAASCSKDGSTFVLVPSSGMAQGTSSATNGDVSSLAANIASCTSNNDCDSGFCAGSSICAPAAAVTLAADSSDVAGPAGATTAGTADGAATVARFDLPPDICLSPNGKDIYVTDYTNNTIRKIDLTLAAGNSSYVTTFAGTAGSAGTTNGACIGTALFNGPEDCAVDKDNATVYVTESGGDCVRKIVIAGCTVSTFAGSCGTSGTTDGTGTDARFTDPKDIVIDTNGTLYVTNNSKTIRKITSAQVVTTFAGSNSSAGSTDGTGTAALFSEPRGLALDSTGTFLYVADQNNGSIRKVNTVTQVVSTLATSLTSIIDVALDPTESFLYAAVAHTIRKVNISTGVATTIAGTASSGLANGNGTSATFNTPEGVALDKEGDILYIADTANNKIRKIQ